MFPHIKQQEKIDCGAACLSMVSQYYGYKGTLGYFRNIVKTDVNGANLYGMVEGAKKLGFDSEALEGDFVSLLDALENQSFTCPFIATVVSGDLLHYVVVYKVTKKYITIGDPASTLKKMKLEEFQQIYSGYIISLKKNEYFSPGNDRKNAYLYLRNIFDENFKCIAGITFLSAVISVIGMVGSLVFGYVVDGLYDIHSTKQSSGVSANINSRVINVLFEQLPNVKIVFILLVLLYILSFVLETVRGFIQIKMSKKINIPILSEYLNHITSMPLSFWETRKSGDMMSRFFEPINLSSSFVSIILTIFIDGLLTIFYGLYMYMISDKLFAISVVTLVIFVIVVYFFKNIIAEIKLKGLQKRADVNFYLKETIDGIQTIKSFSIEKNRNEKGQRLINELIDIGQKSDKISLLQANLSGFIGSIGIVVLLWFGIGLISDNKITSGTLITFYVMLGNFLDPVQNLIGLQPQIQNVLIMNERVYDILSIDPEQDIEEENCDKKVLQRNRLVLTQTDSQNEKIGGNISLKNLSFRYGAKELVIDNLSMEIKEKSKVAIIGESGCGKTTLIKLLMGLYSLEQGQIKIGEVDIKTISKKLLRRKIAYVSQEIYLFNDTLRNNISLLDTHDNEKQIDELISKCGLGELCKKLPYGVDTMIEENGLNLSGGERQKIAIARALYKKPEILILDEATSNLDNISEKKLVRLVKDVTRDTTVITIAHRLSTIKDYDMVYILENGRIAHSGSYQEICISGS